MQSSKSFRNILFIFALEKEASPFITLLSLPQDPTKFQNPVISAYSGAFKSMIISIIFPKYDPKFKCDSIGPENAAVASYIGIKAYNPDLIISAGTSGAFPAEEGKEIQFALGDVCYSKEAIGFIDREIVLPSFKSYIEGKYDVILIKDMFDQLGFKEAHIGTTSSFHDFSPSFSIKKKIDLQDMESAAIGKIAFLMKIPFFALKIVNSLNHKKDQPEEIMRKFFENLTEQSEAFASHLIKFIELLALN